MVKENEWEQIAMFEATATEMRAKRRNIDMLKYMEEGLALRVQLQGRDDAEVHSVAERLVKDYNSVAMQLLREGEHHHIPTLAKAELVEARCLNSEQERVLSNTLDLLVL